ncbi:uncharacterized protein LOC107304482 isoform X2 [Oryza brachyantha]|uniref:uncharacterized protein LOC107304482 isoform X2 n=1 Tax=Oryza brachyantha TaxID=4533 RepID=UPI000776191A|nr:uncharacterized protein LOC107304482 isoform X2 [Oryza brachyantha]
MVISAIACHGWEEEATFCFCLGGHASLKKMTKAFFRITFVEHGKGVDHARKEQLLKNRAFLQGTLLLLVAGSTTLSTSLVNDLVSSSRYCFGLA